MRKRNRPSNPFLASAILGVQGLSRARTAVLNYSGIKTLSFFFFYKTQPFCSGTCSGVDKGQDGRRRSPTEVISWPVVSGCALR